MTDSACGAVHPETKAVCHKDGLHKDHTGSYMGKTSDGRDKRMTVPWPNEDYIGPTAAKTKAKQTDWINTSTGKVRKADADKAALDAPHAYLSSNPAPGSVAAADVSAVRNSDRRKQVLAAVLALAGSATDDEVCVRLADDNMHAGRVASRRGELVESGWLEPLIVGGRLMTRPTRTGVPAQVWGLTASARSSLSEIDLPRV